MRCWCDVSNVSSCKDSFKITNSNLWADVRGESILKHHRQCLSSSSSPFSSSSSSSTGTRRYSWLTRRWPARRTWTMTCPSCRRWPTKLTMLSSSSLWHHHHDQDDDHDHHWRLWDARAGSTWSTAITTSPSATNKLPTYNLITFIVTLASSLLHQHSTNIR